MKDLSLLVWLSQLGLSVALPPAAFIFLAVWLNRNCGWGTWVIWVGIVIGFSCAIQGFRESLKLLERLSEGKKNDAPGISFNDHT